MKAKNIPILIVTLTMLASASFAQNYSIPWFKIDSGGTCTNGQYSLRGTIGQHDAGGSMTNGPYSLTGGFWSFATVVQTPGAPTLKVVPTGPGQVSISWSPATPGYRLQETLMISPANWTDSPSGAGNPATVPITFPGKYYRLIKP